MCLELKEVKVIEKVTECIHSNYQNDWSTYYLYFKGGEEVNLYDFLTKIQKESGRFIYYLECGSPPFYFRFEPVYKDDRFEIKMKYKMGVNCYWWSGQRPEGEQIFTSTSRFGDALLFVYTVARAFGKSINVRKYACGNGEE